MTGHNTIYIGRLTITQVSETALRINGKVIEFNRPITLEIINAVRAVIA